MDYVEIVFLGLVFITVFLLILFVFQKANQTDYRQRLHSVVDVTQRNEVNAESDMAFKVVKVINPFAKFSTPTEGWETSPLRVQFMNAGWRSAHAPQLFFGLKTLLTLLLPLLVFVLFRGHYTSENALSEMFPLLTIAAAVGLVIPKLYLNKKVSERKAEIFETFPDALDLLIICMEAGLSFDQAIARVSSEIKIKSEVLHEEFELMLLENRTGSTREKAMRNLALRTGVEEVETFASMIIQAERFGTSIGESLRVHAEEFRLKRKQKAEEMAAKIPVKLLFPLVVCMLPTVLFIMVGPAVMEVFKNLK